MNPVKTRFHLTRLLLFFLIASTGISEAILSIDTSYDGRYRGQPGFEKILADLPYVYQEALQKISHSLGISIPEKTQIIVVFSDHLTHNGLRLRGKRRSVEGPRGILHYIYLDLEFLMNNQATLLEEMTHELTHAVMSEAMGLAKYDALPMWIKEGTAVHAADQGLARIKALLRRGVNLSSIMNEDEADLGPNPISLEKYVENYLKIQFLLNTYGQETFFRFIQRILAGGQVQAELSQCFQGLTEQVMNLYARDYISRTLIANARPMQAREQLARGIRFFEEKEYLSARLALTDAIDAGISGREFQRAAYLLAECYIQERNPEQAFTVLQRVSPDPQSIPIDRYMFLNAYTRYAMGLCTDAYFLFKQAFETSSNAAVQEGALYYIVRILVELQNYEEAGKALALLRTRHPQSSYIPLASAALQGVQR